MSEHKKDSNAPQQKKPLSHGWIVVPSKTYPDRVYFYNTVTRCSTWNNPCEVLETKSPESNEPKRSSPTRSRSRRKSCEPESNLGQYKSLHESAENKTSKIDSDIEDYDEQHDQYFNNVPVNAFSLSQSSLTTPSSSPSSVSSLKTDINNSDSLKYNSLLENNEKQLWVHFVSTPPKNSARKSIVLSDFDGPSTSILSSTMETIEGNQKKSEYHQSCSKSHASKYSEIGVTKKKKAKKKMKKEFESSSQKKKIEERIIKNSTFRKRDKTPAQSQLLRLRKQNAEKIKELAIKNPDLFASKSGNFDKYRNSTSFESPTDDFSDSYLKRIDICNNLTQETDQPRDDFMEEMDWEPSSEESDVRNINEFRQQLEKVNDSSSDIFFGLRSDHSLLPLSSKTHSWFVILDTNIFVSCLGFVKDLRDMKIEDLGSPVIYVPWRVLQELDHLKDTKIDGVNKRLHANVRKAINYLNENFKMGHPRVLGQSFEDFAKMVDVDASAPDDEILQTCINFQRQHPSKKLMLLTNDKNLESKAIVSRIEVYSKERFQEKFVKSTVTPTTFNTSNKDTTYSGGPNIATAAVDNCLCEIKSLLKDFISLVVETEMKLAFNGDWIKLAFKKPPWSLQDAMDCLFKHWRSVFFLVFSKETESEAQRLYDKLFKKEPESAEDVADIITVTQRLILSIKKSLKKKRPYLDLVDVTLGKLSNALRFLSPNHSPEVDSGIASSLMSSNSTPSGSFCHGQVCSNEISSSDVSRIKNLFKDIWDSLRNFCCSISDIVHSSSARDNTSLQEVRLKMSQIIAQVAELIVIIEKIFEISPTDINENHSLINHFSNFLIGVHPTMDPNLQRDLAKCLAAFFTDFEGRSLLSNSLKDFKEFSVDLMNATDYFNTHLTG